MSTIRIKCQIANRWRSCLEAQARRPRINLLSLLPSPRRFRQTEPGPNGYTSDKDSVGCGVGARHDRMMGKSQDCSLHEGDRVKNGATCHVASRFANRMAVEWPWISGV